MLGGITLFLVLMTAIGYYAGRRVQTMEDYLVAGRKLPFWLAVPTIVATWFGAGSSMGVSGTVYNEGFYGVLSDPFGCTLALLLTAAVFAGPMRRLKLFTISDLLRDRYGVAFERTATLLMVPFYIGTLAAQMVAMGYIFEILTGIDPMIGMMIGSVIVVGYTVFGGMWAVTLTDLVQLVILIAGMVIILPAVFNQLPHPQHVVDEMGRQFGMLGPRQETGLLAYIGRIGMTSLGAIMGQDLLQRIFACRSEAVARSSAFTSAILYFSLGLIPLFIGLAGREIYPSLDNPEQLIPLIARESLSPFLFTVFACGLFSAIMSTADSYLLAGTSLITHNLILPLRPLYSEHKKITLLRSVSIACALTAFCLALSGQTIFNLIVHSGATLFVAIFVPATAALFSDWDSPLSAWSALLCGLGGWLTYLFFNLPLTEEILFAAAATGALTSHIGYFLSTFLMRIPIIERT